MRVALYFLLVVLSGRQPAFAQFACGLEVTISERVGEADCIILAEWVSAEKRLPNDPDTEDSTTYKLVEVIKDSPSFIRRSEIFRFGYQAGKPGDLVLLMDGTEVGILWGEPIPYTQATLDYLKSLPKPDASPEEQLAFFLKHLEKPDERVAEDAYNRVSSTPFEDIKKMAEKFPREKLRQWVASKTTKSGRINQYGLMLGLCGTNEDAKLMCEIIHEPANEKNIRSGIEGVMGGYLLLQGESGLERLENSKLKPGVNTTFHESYAAMLALRFAWDHGEMIKKDRLKQSMRLLLDRPEFADLAIHHLTRWKDWEVQDQVMSLYDKEEFDIPSTKRAIVKYMMDCSRDTKVDDDQNPIQEHAITAKNHLSTLRQKDPETVEVAEKFDYLIH